MHENLDDFIIRLHELDNVAVAKRPMYADMDFAGAGIRFIPKREIPAGHKVALAPIPRGSVVRKCGQVIGFAVGDIAPGDHVHSHNLVLQEVGRDYEFSVAAQPLEPVGEKETRFFDGYLRPDGRVGTRNYLAVISSVNCSASVCRYITDHFRGPEWRDRFPHVDGVVAFTHKSGCCIQPGDPHQLLQRVLAGFARHPNIGGFVIIGLGCEVNQVQFLARDYRLDQPLEGEARPVFMNIQERGGIRRTVEAGIEAVENLLPQADAHRRSRQPAARLVMGMNCGGSDGNSAITANPALGVASDDLIRQGGASVLAETTEIYGAEHLLTRRAATPEVGKKLLKLIRWWEDHVRMHKATIDNNPTFGNKAGGLTTIYEKSLGAVAKAGQAPLMEVYAYAEGIDTPGLSFMDTPGLDPVSMTGLAAGGCNVGVFTTGRGSVYGCKPMPTIKVATNTRLYEHMEEDMDLNAGTILDGTETVAEVGARIFEKILSVAGGEKTKSEAQGLGDEEFAPWILGPTL